MKITLKTIVLVALLVFYIVLIGSNFVGSKPIMRSREGFEEPMDKTDDMGTDDMDKTDDMGTDSSSDKPSKRKGVSNEPKSE